MKLTKEETKELNQFYEELKRIVWEKISDGYEIHPDVLNEISYAIRTRRFPSPFFVSCSVCGDIIQRNKNFKNAVCFECKRKKQKERNKKIREEIKNGRWRKLEK
jgi:hypothetical protein